LNADFREAKINSQFSSEEGWTRQEIPAIAIIRSVRLALSKSRFLILRLVLIPLLAIQHLAFEDHQFDKAESHLRVKVAAPRSSLPRNHRNLGGKRHRSPTLPCGGHPHRRSQAATANLRR
jgi:hypothetical protein